ncbi:MAG: hemerythrin domain-containing protein [Acidimicrobiia bacterium]
MSVPTGTRSTTGDVVDLLVAQHREARRLFSEVEAGGAGAIESFECLVRLLAVHETAEEEVVYPALRSVGAEGERVAEARTAEEDEAKKALSGLEGLGVDGEGFAARFQAFRADVVAHAEAEEREVFPLLRRSLDGDKLDRMRRALEAAEKMAPTHPHPHAPESALGNLVVGPFVAIADRVRDAIRGARS